MSLWFMEIFFSFIAKAVSSTREGEEIKERGFPMFISSKELYSTMEKLVRVPPKITKAKIT